MFCFLKQSMMLNNFLALAMIILKSFVVCKSCHSLYEFQNCYTESNGKRFSKTCSFVKFPHHPQPAHRKPCNERLLKEVALKNRSVRLYPFSVYCNKSIIESLRQFINRPGFTIKCELWRNRSIPDGFLTDVFDGKIWKDCQHIGGKPFLASPNNYALMINVPALQLRF